MADKICFNSLHADPDSAFLLNASGYENGPYFKKA
jgi:hypothetical protein